VEEATESGGWLGVKGPVFSTGWSFYPGSLSTHGLTGLFLYNATSGASYVDLANGSGGWTGVKGPQLGTGMSVYSGHFG
jgi:hypothetical protein